jgi:hypothetical protein
MHSATVVGFAAGFPDRFDHAATLCRDSVTHRTAALDSNVRTEARRI